MTGGYRSVDAQAQCAVGAAKAWGGCPQLLGSRHLEKSHGVELSDQWLE